MVWKGSLWVQLGVFWVFYRRGCFWGVLFHSNLPVFTIRWFMGVLEDHGFGVNFILVYFRASGKVRGVRRVFFETPWFLEKGGVECRWGEVDHGYVAVQWCEKGTMGRLCKITLRVFEEIKERASVHSFWLTKSLGALLTNLNNINMNCTALSVYHMTHENHSGSLPYMWHLSNQPILITYVLNNPLISNGSCPLKCTEFLKQMENWKKQQIHW